MDWRKRQIVQALKISAHALDECGEVVDFEGKRYQIVPFEFAADVVYAMRKAATWMEMEEGEDGEEAETKAAS